MRLLSRARPVLAVVVLLTGVECAWPGKASTVERSPELWGFAVYALSRGGGVPERARAVLAEAEAKLRSLREQGADIAVAKERIGLEGETRLCVTLADKDLARATLERVRQLASGVDLVNVVEEPCGATPAPRP